MPPTQKIKKMKTSVTILPSCLTLKKVASQKAKARISNIFRHLFLSILLIAPISALAFQWQNDVSEVGKYFDNNDAHTEYYYETSSSPNSLALYHADMRGDGIDKVCASVYAFKGTSGFLTKTVNTNYYLINLSKIKEVTWTNKLTKYDNDYLDRYTIILNDGTSIDAIWQNAERIVSCGNNAEGKLVMAPLKWEGFSSHSSNTCVYDESKGNPQTDSINEMVEKIFPFSRIVGTESVKSLLYFSDKGDIKYGYDQAVISQKFSECANYSTKIQALEKKLSADQKARWKALEEEKQRQNLLAEQALTLEAQTMRANIRNGTRTNCGQVFDVKLPMIGVQTMAGMQYIDINRLWGPSANCYFVNGQYVGIKR
jgi:hypothetical protein